jgi:AcrR family transcriptional regulator
MSRMTPDQRRAAIVDAALAVARRKGLASTTVRDVAAEMGTSSGLIHHYFGTMDDVLAAAFENVAAADLELSASAMTDARDAVRAIAVFLGTYALADKDWAFQLWLDAWAEAARRPALQAASRRLNLAWQALVQRQIEVGVEAGLFRCQDPAAASWRLLSMLDGLALQVVAHGTTISREEVLRWATALAEAELGLAPDTLRPDQGSKRNRVASLGNAFQANANRGRTARTPGPS